MAYKFQLGAAVLSGSLTQKGNVLAQASVLSGSSLSLAGVAVTATATELNYVDGVTSAIQTQLDDKLGSGDIGSSVQAYDDGLQYLADLNITDEATFQEQVGLEIGVDVQAYDDQLADVAGLAVTDGGFIVGDGSNFVLETGATARTSLGLGISDAVEFANITGVTGSFTGDLTVNGNLTILGAVVSASVEQLLIEDALITIGDGSTSFDKDYGIEFGNGWASFKTDDANGLDHFASSLPISASAFASDEWEISATHISGNLPVSASAFYGDGSNLTGLVADNAVTAEQLDFKTLGVLENNGNIVQPFTKVDSGVNNAFTATLPTINSANDGKMYIIKDSTGNCGTAGKAVTIAPNGSQKIDNVQQSIVLESSYAAVTLVAAFNGGGGNETWYII